MVSYLTMNRAVDRVERIAMLRRMVLTSGKYMEGCDELSLRDALALEADVHQLVADCVGFMRQGGYSWREIGEASGLSHVGAQLRWRFAADRLTAK